LLAKQQPDGSWKTPPGDASFRLKDAKDLSIYASGVCALMLEVYYRYLPSYSIAESAGLKDGVANEADTGAARLITRLPGGADPMAEIILGIGTESFEPITFGAFNGLPADNRAPLVADEFSIYATMRSTIPVRKAGDWPQTLRKSAASPRTVRRCASERRASKAFRRRCDMSSTARAYKLTTTQSSMTSHCMPTTQEGSEPSLSHA